jgi:hypothetical protein
MFERRNARAQSLNDDTFDGLSELGRGKATTPRYDRGVTRM